MVSELNTGTSPSPGSLYMCCVWRQSTLFSQSLHPGVYITEPATCHSELHFHSFALFSHNFITVGSETINTGKMASRSSLSSRPATEDGFGALSPQCVKQKSRKKLKWKCKFEWHLAGFRSKYMGTGELWLSKLANISFYYMGSSVRGQDEPKPVLWLATRAGKMERSCTLGITRFVPQEKFLWSR